MEPGAFQSLVRELEHAGGSSARLLLARSLFGNHASLLSVEQLIDLLQLFSSTDRIDALEFLLESTRTEDARKDAVDRIADAFGPGSKTYVKNVLRKAHPVFIKKGPIRWFHGKTRSDENLDLIVELHDTSATTSNQQEVLEATMREESFGVSSFQMRKLVERESDCAVDVIESARSYMLEHRVEDVVATAKTLGTFEERVVAASALMPYVYNLERLTAEKLLPLAPGKSEESAAHLENVIFNAKRELPAYPYSPLFGRQGISAAGEKRATYFVVDSTSLCGRTVVTSQEERIEILRLVVRELSRTLKEQLCGSDQRFNVVVYDSRSAAVFSPRGPVLATTEAVGRACAYLRSIVPAAEEKVDYRFLTFALEKSIASCGHEDHWDLDVRFVSLGPFVSNHEEKESLIEFVKARRRNDDGPDRFHRVSLCVHPVLILHDTFSKLAETVEIASEVAHAGMGVVRVVSVCEDAVKAKFFKVRKKTSRLKVSAKRARMFQTLYLASFLASMAASYLIQGNYLGWKHYTARKVVHMHPSVFAPNFKCFSFCKYGVYAIGVMCAYLCLPDRVVWAVAGGDRASMADAKKFEVVEKHGEAVLALCATHVPIYLATLPICLLLLKTSSLLLLTLGSAVQCTVLAALYTRLEVGHHHEVMRRVSANRVALSFRRSEVYMVHYPLSAVLAWNVYLGFAALNMLTVAESWESFYFTEARVGTLYVALFSAIAVGMLYLHNDIPYALTAVIFVHSLRKQHIDAASGSLSVLSRSTSGAMYRTTLFFEVVLAFFIIARLCARSLEKVDDADDNASKRRSKVYSTLLKRRSASMADVTAADAYRSSGLTIVRAEMRRRMEMLLRALNITMFLAACYGASELNSDSSFFSFSAQSTKRGTLSCLHVSRQLNEYEGSEGPFRLMPSYYAFFIWWPLLVSLLPFALLQVSMILHCFF